MGRSPPLFGVHPWATGVVSPKCSHAKTHATPNHIRGAPSQVFTTRPSRPAGPVAQENLYILPLPRPLRFDFVAAFDVSTNAYVI